MTTFERPPILAGDLPPARICGGCGSPVGRWWNADQLCLYCVNEGRDGPQLLHALGRYGIADPVELGFEDDEAHLTAVEIKPEPAAFPWSVGVFPPRFAPPAVDEQLALDAAANDGD